MRSKLYGHRSIVVWFTGLPSSGKSTIANEVDKRLFKLGIKSYVLDGDNIRLGLCRDLGFSEKDREENIRRVAEVSKLFIDAGIVLLAAFVSPLRRHRALARSIIGDENFLEIYCRCPLHVCAKRDPKGLYHRAERGEIEAYTGVTAPYEEPESPDLILDTDLLTPDEASERVMKLLLDRISLSKGNLP